jgi:serine/threonine protein kinase
LSNIEPTPFGDKYVLVEHIATGGMAEIYRAQYSGIEGFAKELVIKRLREEFAARPSVVQMFLDEARVAATLTHQNVVHTYDLGELQGEYYIAMELLKGEELVAVLRRAVKTGRMLPMQIAIGIVMQALEGLHYVHTRTDDRGRLLGLCHRDINPTNIHVGYDGTCKIVDFGIAATRASLQAGGDGQFAGKLAYMAPEQVLGHELDLRADIFALGIVLYEMCLARRLFRGLPEEVAERIVEGDIPAPTFVNSEFPPALEAIIMKALEVDPAERYQNCDHFFRDLEKFTEQAGIRCTPRMISAYMSEMFGEGAPAEVNYDDQYDDLVDEALDFDKFDSLDKPADDAPEWAKSFDAPETANRNKKSMTIGNLEALLGPEFQQLRQQQADASQQAAQSHTGKPVAGKSAAGSGSKPVTRDDAPPATGSQRRQKTRAPAVQAQPEPEEAPRTRRTVPPSGKQGSAPLTRTPTAGRPAVRAGASMTTGALSALEPGITAGSFGHGVVAEQNKKGGAALTWLLVILGLGGLGWIAYTVFTMK